MNFIRHMVDIWTKIYPTYHMIAMISFLQVTRHGGARQMWQWTAAICLWTGQLQMTGFWLHCVNHLYCITTEKSWTDMTCKVTRWPKDSGFVLERKWKHSVRTGNVLTLLLGNDLYLDLLPWTCSSLRSRSTSRSLHSKIVKTFLVRTCCFHNL